MTLAAQLTAVNCTSCGAGLNVLGGGRVMVHVCPYCGAGLDAQHDYRVLAAYDRRPRPDTPFRLGMTGALMGVDWMIIGIIGLREDRWAWTEHQLYSPTHGYAWLNLEDGHMTFSRRMRHPSTPAWIDSRMVEAADNRPSVLLKGERFVYYETSTPTISYLEGEFTWAPALGDSDTIVTLLSETAMLDFSTSGAAKEREVYRTVRLTPTEVRTAFGMDDLPAPDGPHPLMPFTGGDEDGFILRAAGGFAVAALVAAIVIAATAQTTTVLPRTTVRFADLPRTLDFEVAQTDRLVRIDLESPLSNAWLFVGFEVTTPEDETLFESGRSMEFYSGRDTDGDWTEGNRTSDLKFRPPAPGRYQITFSEVETELWSAGAEPTQFSVAVTEGVRAPGWLVMLALGFGLLAGVPKARRLWHRKQRFSGSDWEDDGEQGGDND